MQLTNPTLPIRFKWLLAVLASLVLNACGNGSGGAPAWLPNAFSPFSIFANRCDALNQRFYLRSVFQQHYYWYDDIVDANPASFASISAHFDYLVTDALSPTGSGKNKDEFSTFVSSSEFSNIISGDGETGYGLRLTSSEPSLEGDVYVGFVVDASPAANAGIVRGDKITAVDGLALNGPEREQALAGLFPDSIGESHTLELNDGALAVTLTASTVNFDPVAQEQVLPGTNVGYLLFNEHTLDAEEELFAAFAGFAAHNGGAGIDELVLDMRYNPGGLLFVANQVTRMIAGSAATDGKLFEQLRFNNRFAARNLNFVNQGLNPATGVDEALPELNLNRVFILVDHATCSASESIINSLRGIDFEVVLVGETTCGKPYGFIGFDNCATTFLPIEFQSFNHKGESNYSDGFRPGSSGNGFGQPVSGCVVADDFGRELGDPQEARLAAALDYIATGACPPAPLRSVSSAFSQGAVRSPSTAPRQQNINRLRATRGLRVLAE